MARTQYFNDSSGSIGMEVQVMAKKRKISNGTKIFLGILVVLIAYGIYNNSIREVETTPCLEGIQYKKILIPAGYDAYELKPNEFFVSLEFVEVDSFDYEKAMDIECSFLEPEISDDRFYNYRFEESSDFDDNFICSNRFNSNRITIDMTKNELMNKYDFDLDDISKQDNKLVNQNWYNDVVLNLKYDKVC